MMKRGDLVQIRETDKEGVVTVRVDSVSRSGDFFQGYRADDPTQETQWYRVKDVIKEGS